MMVELNETNFKQEIANKKLILVDFYATWCGPCGVQSEVLNKIQKSRAINFDIVKVNVDEAPNIAMEYGIESIPTLLLFKDNILVNRTIGLTMEEEIIDIVKQYE